MNKSISFDKDFEHETGRVACASFSLLRSPIHGRYKSVVGALLLFYAQEGVATDFFWTDASSNFNAPGSWFDFDGGTIPSTADRAIFYQSGFGFQPQVTADISVGGVQLFSWAGSLAFSASTGATLTVGSLGILNTSANTLTFNSSNLGLALSTNASFTGNGTINIGSSTASLNLGSSILTLDGTGIGSTIAKGIAASSGSLVKTDAGTWTLSATNLHAGGTSINGGTLVVSAANALGSSGTVGFGGGTLQYSGAASTTDYSSRFSTAASQQFKFNTNGETVALASALNSSGATLAKSGIGTLSLTANANSASGGTTVNGGVLRLTGTANSIGAVVVNTGGTLQIGATNTLVNTTALTLNGGTLQISGGAFSQDFGTTALRITAASVIDFGTGLGASAIVFGASNLQSWSGSLTISNYSTAGGDTLRFGTSASGLTGAQLTLINFDGIAAQIDASGFVAPVPEPATYAVAIGLGVFAFVGSRRRRAVT